MTNSRLTTPVLLWTVVVVSLTTSGCASMTGTTDKWATAWRKSTEPKPADPNNEEIVTYWGQKKKETKPAPMSADLKERLAKKSDPSQPSRDYTDNFKAGNQRLKEGRLEEARRAYELALAAKPDDPDVHHRLAVVADKQQMFGAADDHYDAALRKRPRDPNLLSDIGYSNLLRGDNRRAETILREALAIDPSHKGAMLNLGTLYGKQGRYEDTLAVFRRGTTDAEAKQYLAQLFPQGPPSGVALASNQAEAAERIVRPIPLDERTDVRTGTLGQLKVEMERRQSEGSPNRQQQFAQTPAQRDWAGDSQRPDPGAMPDPRSSAALNSQPWTQGQTPGTQFANPTQSSNPGFGQSVPYSPPIQPGAPMASLPANSPSGFPAAPSVGTAWNGPVQQQGYTAAPAQSQGSLVAPPGTSPHANMDFWQGAPVQTAGGVQPNSGAFNSTPPQSQYAVEQISHSQAGSSGGVSASQAAAQLGMSAGPGSLFPIVTSMTSDAASSGGMSQRPSVTPAYEQRSGGELSQPPQYQNQGHQYAPTQMPGQNRIQLLGSDGSASNPATPNWPGASSRSNGNAQTNGNPQQGFAGNDVTISPSSPAGNMPRQWNAPPNEQPVGSNTNSNVFQAGGSSPWDQTDARSGDPHDSFQSDTSGVRKSRYAKAPWDDPTSQPVGSRPYNGAWPNNNPNSNAASTTNGGSSNFVPMWNGGSGAGASMPNGAGNATGNSSNSSLQQWPYSPQR